MESIENDQEIFIIILDNQGQDRQISNEDQISILNFSKKLEEAWNEVNLRNILQSARQFKELATKFREEYYIDRQQDIQQNLLEFTQQIDQDKYPSERYTDSREIIYNSFQ